MKKAIGPRQSGKTRKLIKLSASNNTKIIVKDKDTARMLKKTAEEMELTIPEPVTVPELTAKMVLRGFNPTYKSIIIDDTESVLKALLKEFNIQSIEAISITTNDMSDELI